MDFSGLHPASFIYSFNYVQQRNPFSRVTFLCPLNHIDTGPGVNHIAECAVVASIIFKKVQNLKQKKV